MVSRETGGYMDEAEEVEGESRTEVEDKKRD